MSIISSLYAEKVFAEHPIGLWPLNDQLDYISLISENNRDIQNFWNYSDATVTEYLDNKQQPFLSSILNHIEFDLFSGSSKEIKFVGPDIISVSDLDSNIQTITTASYFYSNSAYLSSVSIGFEYTDSTSAKVIEKFETFNVSIPGQWFLASSTLEYPNELVTLRPIIKIKYLGSASSTHDYIIYNNGLSFGQNAERFNAISLGTDIQLLPSNINLDSVNHCVPARSYGFGQLDGYYLISENTMLCRNQGIPMVFGNSHITKLIPDKNNNPSLLIPGLGFLNEIGRFKEYTVEMWIKINANTIDPLRIFGPIASKDGIYIEHGFITLVIDNNFKSYFVGEWSRPMLLQIRMSNNNISMLLNGDEIINMFIDTNNISLPSEYDQLKSNDWLAFYSYNDISIDLDCVSIYPYKIPLSVAKKRWIYGQATPTAQEIDVIYNGKSVVADYTFSEYTSNYNYPKHGSWSQGISDNLGVNANSIYIPEYNLPDMFLENKTLNNLYEDCKIINNLNTKFITFRPNSSWDNLHTYMRIPAYSFIKEEVYSLYGVFSIDQEVNEEQVLIELSDSSNYLRASLKNNKLVYSFNYNQELIYFNENSINLNNNISAGFNFQTLVSYFGKNMLSFLNNKSYLNIYIAGNKEPNKSFLGKIYTFSLCSKYNSNKIKQYFNDLGIILNNYQNELLQHIGSYTLIPEKEYELFYIDIGVSAYWQDHIPLSYFASYVKNENGKDIYDLDFLQFNIDNPSNFKFKQVSQANTWTYDDLENKFDFPIQQQYNQLDNQLYTGWSNYTQLDEEIIPTTILDLSNNNINSYITLQYVSQSANKTINEFSLTKNLEKSKIIDFGNIPNWDQTVCEIVDNTLIYLPKTVNFNQLAIVLHIDFNVRGISSKPIKIQNIELASKSLNKNSFNAIGTKYAKQIYPYVKSGIYYDYKIKNPISIYKGSTPYLYNSSKDGFEIKNDLTEHIQKGIAIPMNENTTSSFFVNGVQLWFKYNLDSFPYGKIPVFEIDYADDVIQFFAIATSQSGKIAKIIAESKNNKSLNGMSLYLNGLLVIEPTIDINSWNAIGIAFNKNINLSNKVGYVNINGPFIYNNISYYQSTNLKDVQSLAYRPWLKVLNNGINDIYWEYWFNNYLWDGVLVLSSTNRYSTNLKNVYSSYAGTNKIIFDSDSEDISFSNTSVQAFNDVQWQSYVANPA